ncbi:hypothetical protein BASA60_002564 [Batrachochytrium salamandrivorans]|nr:hypothetical protein BASA60_002564 [Batrachochytrium salamandrivorans]
MLLLVLWQHIPSANSHGRLRKSSEHRASSNVDAAQICKLSSLFTLTKLRHFTPALPRRQTRQEYASGSVSDNEATGKTSSAADAGSVLSLTSLNQRYCDSPCHHPTNYSVTLKLDLDLQTTFHVVERGWSAGLASIYMSVHEILVNCRFGMKLSASVSSPFIYRGTEAEWPRSNFSLTLTHQYLMMHLGRQFYLDLALLLLYCIYCSCPLWSSSKVLQTNHAPIAAAVSTGSAVVKFIPLFPIYVQSAPVATSACAVVRRIPYYSTFSIPSAFLSQVHSTAPSHLSTPVPLLIPALADVAIVSSEASAEAPIEVPTEAACSAVESAFSPAVAAQAMVSVFDCDVVASSLAAPTNLAPHSYDKPFWERSSRRKVVALPSLHMAMVDYNDWLITYDSRGSVVFQPRETVV